MNINLVSEPDREARRVLPVYSGHLDMARGLAALTVLVGHTRFLLEDVHRPSSEGSRLPASVAPLGDGVGVANSAPAPSVAQIVVPSNPMALPSNPMAPPHEAVLVFFVLSGCLVGGSVCKEYAAQRFSWKSYSFKRLTRLLIVLIPALLLGCGIDLLTRRVTLAGPAGATGKLEAFLAIPLSVKTLLANLCFLQNLNRTGVPPLGSNMVLWSLAFEFWYYCLFPLLIALVFVRSFRHRLAYLLPVCGLCWFLWREPLVSFPIWVVGAVVARLPAFIPGRWQRSLLLLCTAQFLVGAALLWKHPLHSIFVNNLLLTLSFAALLYAMLHRSQRRSKGPYAWLAEGLARPSYSLYLLHLPVLTFVLSWCAVYHRSLLEHRAVSMLFLDVTVFGVCYVFYLAFEAHTERVKERLRRLSGAQHQSHLPGKVEAAIAPTR